MLPKHFVIEGIRDRMWWAASARQTFATLLALGLLFFAAVHGYSQSAEEAELKGESAQKNGDLDSAIANFSEAIRLDPKLVTAYNARGLAYRGKGNYDKAIADFSDAIRLDPKSATAYSGRAGAYHAKRNYDKAIADFSEAVRLDPKSATAYSGRADAYAYKGDPDKAIRDSLEAIRLDPKCARAHNSLGVAYDGYAKEVSRADAATAESLFDRASEYFDGPPRKLDGAQQPLPFDGSVEDFRAATRKLDRTHKMQLLYDYSAAAFKAAIDIEPDYDFGNNNLGVYYARRGGPEDMQLAEKYFRSTLIINQRYADAYNNLGIVLRMQATALRQKAKLEEAVQKVNESILTHKKGLKIRNDKASDHNNLCGAYLEKYYLDAGVNEKKKSDLDDAMNENTIALQCDPNFLEAWNSRSQIFARQDNLDEAADCVLRMVVIGAKMPQTIQKEMNFAVKCIELKRFDQAIDLLTRSLKINAGVPEIYYARAAAYVRKGDLIGAQHDLEQVLRIRPDYPHVQQWLKEIRAQLANPKK